MVDLHPIEKAYTISEYLAREDASEVRHEFNNGNLTEIAGGILPHNVIKGEFYTLRSALLKLESLGLELSLDELYAVLDKLPKE